MVFLIPRLTLSTSRHLCDVHQTRPLLFPPVNEAQHIGKRMIHLLTFSLPSTMPNLPPKSARQSDKLDSIFLAIKKEKLTFGEFVYLASRHKDENNQPIQRSQTHATSISSFLQGKTTHTPSMIVDCWYQSADGRASASGSIPLFATSPVYTEIKPARAGQQAHIETELDKPVPFRRVYCKLDEMGRYLE